MTGIPGTPAIQNAMPMPYFGPDTFAAPGLGTIAGLVMLVFGTAWLEGRAARGESGGEHRGWRGAP